MSQNDKSFKEWLNENNQRRFTFVFLMIGFGIFSIWAITTLKESSTKPIYVDSCKCSKILAEDLGRDQLGKEKYEYKQNCMRAFGPSFNGDYYHALEAHTRRCMDSGR